MNCIKTVLRRGILTGLAILAACTALMAVTACAPLPATGPVVSAPAVLADRTVADEKAMLAGELAYKAARLAAETATDAGLIKGPRAAALADADMRAYTALLAAREAYRGANAATWIDALTRALAAIDGVRAAIKGA